MAGILLVASAILCSLVALDLYTYRQILVDKPIATISFERVEHQAYIATVTFAEDGLVSEYYLRGDQWQIDARLIRWKGIWSRIGGKPGYRLERISGRYISLEDERSLERTVYALREESELAFDLWAWAYKQQSKTPIIEAVYGSATFVPMADGALYELGLSYSGLVAKPLNETAKRAVNHWIN